MLSAHEHPADGVDGDVIHRLQLGLPAPRADELPGPRGHPLPLVEPDPAQPRQRHASPPRLSEITLPPCHLLRIPEQELRVPVKVHHQELPDAERRLLVRPRDPAGHPSVDQVPERLLIVVAKPLRELEDTLDLRRRQGHRHLLGGAGRLPVGTSDEHLVIVRNLVAGLHGGEDALRSTLDGPVHVVVLGGEPVPPTAYEPTSILAFVVIRSTPIRSYVSIRPRNNCFEKPGVVDDLSTRK